MAKRKTIQDAAVQLTLGRAAEEIAKLEHAATYVLIRRAKDKKERLNPTLLQTKLLAYVRSNGPFTFHQTLGMDWRFLGGLLARGLLSWRYLNDGSVLLMPTKKGLGEEGTKTISVAK